MTDERPEAATKHGQPHGAEPSRAQRHDADGKASCAQPHHTDAKASRERRRDATLVAGFFAGPLAWFLDLVGGYALVLPSREAGSKAWLYAITAFALALSAAGAAAAWHVFRGLDPLEDQQLAGLIMWVPTGVIFVVLGLAFFAAWLGYSERRAARSPHEALRGGCALEAAGPTATSPSGGVGPA